MREDEVYYCKYCGIELIEGEEDTCIWCVRKRKMQNRSYQEVVDTMIINAMFDVSRGAGLKKDVNPQDRRGR